MFAGATKKDSTPLSVYSKYSIFVFSQVFLRVLRVLSSEYQLDPIHYNKPPNYPQSCRLNVFFFFIYPKYNDRQKKFYLWKKKYNHCL